MQVITLIHYLGISGIEVYYSNYFHSLRLITIVGSMNTLAHYMLGVFLGVSCKYQPIATGLLRISIVHLLAVTLHIRTSKCPMN